MGGTWLSHVTGIVASYNAWRAGELTDVVFIYDRGGLVDCRIAIRSRWTEETLS